MMFLIHTTIFLCFFWICYCNGKNVPEELGYCAPYNGKVCKSFISSVQVWFSKEDPTGGWENEKITTHLFEELIDDLPDLCKFAAQRLLCTYAFPKCVNNDGKIIKLPMCYEDCVATHLTFCYNDWVLIEEKKQRGLFLKSREHFRYLEQNDDLVLFVLL